MLELVAFIMHDDGPTHLRAPKIKIDGHIGMTYKETNKIHLKEYETDPKFYNNSL